MPGISSPGISRPGISRPGTSSPGIPSHGISSPGISRPDISSPGISRDCCITNLTDIDVAVHEDNSIRSGVESEDVETEVLLSFKATCVVLNCVVNWRNGAGS